MIYDSTMKCLCCDQEVLTNSKELSGFETPAVICRNCYGFVPPPILKVIFLMRCQIATLHNEMKTVQRDIKRIFKAQQDIEQAAIQ